MKKIFSFLLLVSIVFVFGCSIFQCRPGQCNLDNVREKQYSEDESIK